MLMKHICLVCILLLGSLSAVHAHSSTKMTIPEAGAILNKAPDAVVLTFIEPARVTKVLLTHKTDASSQSVDLKIPTKEFVTTIKLATDMVGAGDYQIIWRALGHDGHPVNGAFSFKVTGE
ncbi:MAG: copper resistance CopC family protein [Hyphomicrobiales bacterium]